MIKVFQYKNGEIIIRRDEPLMMKDYKYEWREKQIQIKTYQLSLPYTLGVELAVYRGGRICYGMLTAQVKPKDKKDRVNLSLALTQENTIQYEGACIIDNTYVYKGLPEEYADEIINKISSFMLKKESFPQCDIFIEDSANCEVGSSPMIFGIIAEIMINLISSGEEDAILNLDIETFTKLYVNNINLKYKAV